jgi:ATP-binding cassette subfamily B protein
MRDGAGSTHHDLGPAGFFWSLALAAPLRALLVFGASVVYWSMPLVAGLVLRLFFDVLSGRADAGRNVWTLAALYLSLDSGRGIWWVGAGALSEYHLAVAGYLLRRNLFSQVLRGVSFRIPVSPGEFMDRFREDTGAISEPVFYATVGSGQLVSTGATLWVLLSINVPLTIVVFLTPLLTYGIMQLFGGSIKRSHRAARESSEHASGFLTELLANVQALQVAGAESAAAARFERLNDARKRTAIRSALQNGSAAALNTGVVGLAVGMILLLAAVRFTGLSIGELALFSGYVAFGVVGDIADFLSRLMRSLRQAGVSVSRLKELVTPRDHAALVSTVSPRLGGPVPVEIQAKPAADDLLRALTVLGLGSGMDGSARGITGIDLSVLRGQVVVITGRVGAGKSLLLETLLGFAEKG